MNVTQSNHSGNNYYYYYSVYSTEFKRHLRTNMRTWAILFVTWCLLLGVDGRRRNLPLTDRPNRSHGDDDLEEDIACERRSKCGDYSATLPFHARNCFCDASCRAYGDCCQDYTSIRVPSPPPPPPGQGTTIPVAGGPDPALKGTVSCRRNEDVDRTHEIYVVDHCPRSYQQDAVRRNCENERAPEVFNRLPVTGRTSGVLYRNVYCAVCSGDREFVFWELAYRCNGMRDAAVVTTIDSAEEFRRLTTAPPPIHCTLQLLPPLGLTPRKCKSSIDECDRDWKDGRVAKKCKSYTSYVYLDLETYKNRHCAICNFVKNSSLTCYDQRTPHGERSWDDSRYIVYDVNTRRAFVRRGKSSAENQGNGNNKDTARELGNCTQGSVYDILTDECRCAVEKCLEMSTTQTSKTVALMSVVGGVTRPPSRAVERQSVTTVAAKTRGRKTTVATSVATKRYAKTTVATTKATKTNRPSKHTVPTAGLLRTLRSTGLSSSTRESRSTRASTISTASISTIVTSANTVTSTSAWTDSIKYRTTTSNIFNLVPSAVVTFTNEVNTTTAASTLLRTATVDFNSFADKTSKAATLDFEVETGLLSTASPVASLRIENGILENSERRTHLNASVAGSSLIMTTSGAVSLATTTTTTTTTTTRVDHLLDQRDPDDYPSEETKEKESDARWRNCSDIRAMFLYDRLQSLASFVATLVSMVCLLVTFVAILLLPLMQTMRGKILLSLSLCLFIGQLLYLLALPSNQPFRHQAACYWLGCALHYFVLVGFFWTSVLAFDTSWSVIGDRLDDAAVGSARYAGYSVYAWLTPASIVVAGVVADFFGADRLLIRPCYGQGVCFITGTFSLLLIFAVPAGILVLISVFVYFLAASNACFEASRTKSKRSKNGTRGSRLLALCLSLTLLAALTWVAAFVAAFHGPRMTWWAFVAMSPLQGIFIFVAFICRRSVLEQLGRMRRRRQKGEGKRPNGSSATQWSYRRDFSTAMTDRRDLGISNPEFLQNETYM